MLIILKRFVGTQDEVLGFWPNEGYAVPYTLYRCPLSGSYIVHQSTSSRSKQVSFIQSVPLYILYTRFPCDDKVIYRRRVLPSKGQQVQVQPGTHCSNLPTQLTGLHASHASLKAMTSSLIHTWCFVAPQLPTSHSNRGHTVHWWRNYVAMG